MGDRAALTPLWLAERRAIARDAALRLFQTTPHALAFCEAPDPYGELDLREGNAMPPKFAKLAGLGALGAIVLFLALYAFIIKISVPGQYSGIDMTQSIVVWIAIGLVILALAGLHVVIGRQLLSLGKGTEREATRKSRKDR